MANEDVEINGLDGVVKALDKLPARLQRAVMRPALSAAGQVMLAGAEQTAPEGPTGELEAALDYKVSVSMKDDAQVIVGPKYTGLHSEDPGVYGKFTELGTKNQPPQFWLSKAFEATKKTAADAAIQVIQAIVEKLPE